MNTHNNSHNISYYILYLFYAFIETNLKQKIKIEFFFYLQIEFYRDPYWI